jgi:hypothetical protein
VDSHRLLLTSALHNFIYKACSYACPSSDLLLRRVAAAVQNPPGDRQAGSGRDPGTVDLGPQLRRRRYSGRPPPSKTMTMNHVRASILVLDRVN